MWPEETVCSPWPNTLDVQVLNTCLLNNIRQNKPVNTLYVSQWVLTPNVTTILTSISSSIRHLSDIVSPWVNSWLKSHLPSYHLVNGEELGLFDESPVEELPNIVIRDFYDLEFVELIIHLNLHYNHCIPTNRGTCSGTYPLV
eukprot:TRINITY_DN14866_c0_g1_i1.p1 TRINITY_DN14866_c0_g1~~TRINITY_DN14866_c0_g1_i1.p1  ORF type:complete len:143 (-),score=16.86 TRINITY_DN14866_c0_g1_i1:75-503(-)